MPSVAVGSKNKGKNLNRDRRSRSRQGTPASVSTTAHAETSPIGNGSFHTSLIDANLAFARSLLDIIGEKSTLPSPATVASALDHTRSFHATSCRRGDKYDSLLREATKKLKELEQEEREQERVEKEMQAQEAEEQRKQKLKKSTPKKREREEDRPPAVGEHKVARQDGVAMHDDSSEISSPPSPHPPSLMGENTADRASKSRSSSAEPRQPPPAPAITSYQLFGQDPNTFPDPIVYDIREITPGMTEEEKLEIYQVASYPHDDLHTLIAGPLPDKDFSNAKDTVKQSATAVQFATYVEPFIRPLNDEDTAFLRDRGDRVQIYEATPRGPKSYRDLWTEEDGGTVLDLELGQPPNEARGTMDDMNDAMAEGEDISAGPLQERLLQLLRPQRAGATHVETAGDTSMVNGIEGDGDGDGDGPTVTGDSNHQTQQPAAFLPESTNVAWKTTTALLPELVSDPDKRILQELKHIGFIPEDADFPNYDAAQDNEVAERLRILQERLKKQTVVNAARKARVLELTEERMAVQEYMNIADDLDNQLNQAYLKRNRNLGKSKKNPAKKAQVPGMAESMSRPAMGEGIRSLMERKFKWNDWIGKVVNYGRAPIPTETVFPKQLMDEYERKEEALWEAETNEV